MVVHTLKIKSEYLSRIKTNQKMFEVRFNDRDYQVGDQLHFKEIRKDDLCRDCSVQKEITYIHSGLGMKDGYMVLGLSEKEV
ncbi:MAG: DUF3850 domain-containing protein [Planctomycetes bacterium]|nr:DUF3850 domain-containing protein [Planctomycetota bacterium]